MALWDLAQPGMQPVVITCVLCCRQERCATWASVCSSRTAWPHAALSSSQSTGCVLVRPRRKPEMVPKAPSVSMWNTSFSTLVRRRRACCAMSLSTWRHLVGVNALPPRAWGHPVRAQAAPPLARCCWTAGHRQPRQNQAGSAPHVSCVLGSHPVGRALVSSPSRSSTCAASLAWKSLKACQ